MKFESVAFTGGRPKKLFPGRNAYDENLRGAYAAAIDKIAGLLLWLHDECQTGTFISGGAQGFDQLAFWSEEKLKKTRPDVRNLVYAPCRGQESKWMPTGLFGKEEYRTMLNAADGVRYIHDEAYKGPYMLFDRNSAMLDDGDAVVALYPDGTWKDPEQKGGTAGTMREAARRGMPIIQLPYGPEGIGTIGGSRFVKI